MSQFFKTLLTLCLLVLVTACSKGTEDNNKLPDRVMGEIPLTQLPADVTPLRYHIKLFINPGQDSFKGKVAIDINLSESRKGLWMHGQGLNIETAIIKTDKGSWPLTTQQVNDSGVLRLDFTKIIPAGNATLEFEYQANFDRTGNGLFKIDEANHAYVFSQFESTFARKAFPSFDEPGFKTPFDIQLVIPRGQTGLSNAPEISVKEIADDQQEISFALSKDLPTYLVAFAVGPFDMVKGESIKPSELRQEPIPLRAFAVKGKGPELAFALANTASILLELEKYFDYAYPYAKLDLIAVPPMGNSAMENAGAITYGEQLILFNDGSTVEQERGFLSTHAHELAHQWFGNLVTPKWWDDIWLNEAFATWMAATILHELYPGEHYLEDKAAGTAFVMTQDSLVTARQIRQPIKNQGDIMAAFDGITYIKGGGVLSMFESFMGADAFRKGIRHYMDKHAWGNTDANDFLIAISEVNDDVDAKILIKSFNSFIEQPGVPIVNFDLQCGESNYINLTQSRYFPIGSVGASEQTWDIPVCVKYSQEGKISETCNMMTSANHSLALNKGACPEFLIPNAEGKSYYRWNLTPVQWDKLLGNFEKLNANEQLSAASSLSAAFNIAEIDLETYLKAVEVLARSPSRQVATAPINDLLPIAQYFAEGQELDNLQRRMAKFYKPRLDALHEIEDKNAEEQQLYNYLLSIVARFFNDQEWRDRLKHEAINYTGFSADGVLNPEKIDVNIRSNALRVAADDLGLPFVQHLWSLVLSTDDAALRELMIRAMAFSGNPEAAAFVRSLILDENLRQEEIGFILFHQGYYKSNRDAVWLWTQNNYDTLLQKMGEEAKGQLVGSFYSFCTVDKANEVEAFFKTRVDDKNNSSRSLNNTLETIRLCAAFVDAHNPT